MYSNHSLQGDKMRYSFDRNRFNDLDRLSIIAELSSYMSDYKTFVPTRIGHVDTVSMIDTGNSFATVINGKMQKALNIKKSDLRPYKGRTSIGTAKVAARMEIAGETKKEHKIYLSSSLPPIKTRLVILPQLGMPINISGRTLEECNMSVLAGKHVIYKGTRIPLVERKNAGPELHRHSAAHMLPIYTACDVTLEPFEEVHISAVAIDDWENREVSCAIISPSPHFEEQFNVSPWRSAAISLRRGEGEEDGKYQTKIGMLNPTSRPVRIPKGTRYGIAELITSINDPRRDDYRVCYMSSNTGRRQGRVATDKSRSGTGSPPGHSDVRIVGTVTADGNGRKPKTDSKSGSNGNGRQAETDSGDTYVIPPSPDKQDDPLSGDPVNLPAWMKGAVTVSTWQKRYSYLEKLYDVKGNKNFDTADKRKLFIKLLLLHWELFAWDGSYGKTNLIQHYIKTSPDCKPVNERYRPPNPALRPALRKQIETWLKTTVIEGSDSEWNSNLLACVKSSNINAIRWCVDYRKLNKATTIDRFPIGDINDNLSRLGKSQYFSCLDNSGAFHCIEIAPEDRHKTSFATPFNTYQFCRLPFGLSGGPSSYARLVVEVLKHIPPEQAVAYVDDVLVHSADFEQHLVNLHKVFTAYTKAGLKLNPKKCKFMASKIDYLGHSVSKAGIEPQEAYVKVVKDWPLPQTRQDILVFLGKVGYYRKFIENFAKIAQPLTDLLRIAGKKPSSKDIPVTPLSKSQRRKIMDEPIELSAKAVESFETLKQSLLSEPIHGHPRFDNLKEESYILDTDWCQETNTCSGCLSQYQKDDQGNLQEKSIGYASKKLNKSQANYSSPKGEICAILLMMDHFKYHLMIGHFLLRTDSIAARALKENTTDPQGYLSRWKGRLANYDFTVIHRAGTKHGNADALSRINHTSNRPEDNEDVFDEKTDRQYLFAIDEDQSKSSTRDEIWTPLYIKELQEEDPEFLLLKKWVKLGTKPDTQSRAEASSNLKSYINLFESLYIDSEDLLRYKYSYSPPDGLGTRERDLIVLPEQSLRDAVRIIHEKQAHVGVKNTIDVSMRHVFGVGLRDVAEYVCQTCLVCQAKGRKPKPQDYSLVCPRQGMPFQTINLDFVGPLTPSKQRGNIFLLTVEDMLSRWVEAFPLKRATANEVANKLTTEIFPRHGYPEFIKSDRGSHFKNHTLQELADITGIKLVFSPSYRPQSNPVERAHGSIKNMLRALILDLSEGNPSEWENHLPAALFCYRTTRHSATGFSPFEMLFGHSPSTEASLIFGPPPERSDYQDQRSHAIAHRDRMNQAFQWANRNITATIARRRRYYYSNPKRLFEVGDLVWLLTPIVRPGQRKSFISPYSGPWTVSKRVNEVVYEILPHPEWSRKGSEVVTVDRIKKYRAPDDEGEVIDETHPPGISQDLSLPGNEFLETFRTMGKPETTANESDDEDESGNATNGNGVPLNGNGNVVLGNGMLQTPIPTPVPSGPPSRAGSPLLSPPISPVPQPVVAQPNFFAEPDLHEVVVPAEQPVPLPVQPRAEPAAPGAGAAQGARRKDPTNWASRRKDWRDISPVRQLPTRKAATRSIHYRQGRRQTMHSSSDDEIAELDDEASSPCHFEWDDYDLTSTCHKESSPAQVTDVPPLSDSMPHDANTQIDISDQSKVLTQRRSYAEKNDSRQDGRNAVRRSHIPRPSRNITHSPVNFLATVQEGARGKNSLPPPPTLGSRRRRRTPPCAPPALPIQPGRSKSAQVGSTRRRQPRSQSAQPDSKQKLLRAASAHADDAKVHIDAVDPPDVLSGKFLKSEAFSTPHDFKNESQTLRHCVNRNRPPRNRHKHTRNPATGSAEPRHDGQEGASSSQKDDPENQFLIEKLIQLEKQCGK